jgi:ABC-type spermidine/putrescine transport system permease subunit I
MNWYSINGTGATIHDIERTPDGRVEFTVWLSVFWIPLVPIASWSAVYIGDQPDAFSYSGDRFTDLVRKKHDWVGLVQTFGRGVATVVICVGPAAYMIARTQGRAATLLEMVFVFASAAWPVLVIIGLERYRRNKLKSL